MEPPESARFFRGTELTRLMVLTGIMVVGWGLVWQYAIRERQAQEPVLRAGARPAPIVPDHSIEFETVVDRTPMSFRDNGAYAMLLERARGQTPVELAGRSRRDIVFTHIWERPELYRGVPIHIQGTALRVIRFESKLSKSGWLHEAWIITPEARNLPYDCVFEEPPEGFPLGTDISERVVFNGYFLKIMKYQAGDMVRGAPVLVGKLGWEPRTSEVPAGGQGRTFQWSLWILGVVFVLSLGRWAFQLIRYLSGPGHRSPSRPSISDELDPEELDALVRSLANRADQPVEGDPGGSGEDRP